MLTRQNILSVTLLIVAGLCAYGSNAQSPQSPHTQSQPQSEKSQLPTNNSPIQPSPIVTLPTMKEISEVIINNIDTVVRRYESRHPPPPTDNSGWWFNFLLVIFTGALVVVGAFQGYLIFWTLKATTIAATAAKQSADVAELALTDLEGPFLYPVIEHQDISSTLGAIARYNHPTSPFTPPRPVISFRFRNYGRSPALPQNVGAVFFYGQPADVYHDQFGGFAAEMLINAGAVTELPVERRMIEGIGREEHKNIMEGADKIYLRGSVTYFDIFGNRYEQRFCLAWRIDTHSFMAWGTDDNRRRRLPT